MGNSTTLKDLLAHQGVVIVDGGLATELERRGADLRHALWSARMLIERPDLVRDVHLDFLRAGADVLVTASYQASLDGFERAGLDRRAAIEVMRRSVALAVEARDAFLAEAGGDGRLRPLVAASIGPYGACLMDGSEYSGDYPLTRQELIDFHRPRMEILADTQADLLALETIPSRLEAEALLELLEEFPHRVAWMSFSCRDAEHVSHGESFAECAAMAAEHPRVVAVGLNCTNPSWAAALLASAGDIGKPLLAYPNSGETWDPETHDWHGGGQCEFDPGAWFDAGARLIGGCCRVYPEQISAMRRTLLSRESG